ncbi:MAG TPA: RNA-binding protein [Gammaproteobacteria bacterium]|nr:RNA-binding protein [Gammaproteobacteria bacterium]|tara:strand:- start:15794 stop:16192 length:399 start_codon:yes stop_codon:yes gene_type:complete
MDISESVRIDRWLWAARFFKTRSLAKTAIDGGKVHLDGQRTKPAKEIHIGQTLTIRRGQLLQVVEVKALSEQRGSAPVAQALYQETPASIEEREILRSRKRMENAGLIVVQQRPDKKDRRALAKLKNLDSLQ